MEIRNPGDLGLAVRRGREKHGWSQAELGRRIGASRHWVLAAEKGKPSAEIGLVLKALAALGLYIELSEPVPAAPSTDTASAGAAGQAPDRTRIPEQPFIPDLSVILALNTGSRDIRLPYVGSDGDLRRGAGSGEDADVR
jgi:HTH-type transcriptional regulator / antitoxin HipB